MTLACTILPPIFCNKRAQIFGVQKLPLFDPVQENYISIYSQLTRPLVILKVLNALNVL